MEASSKKLLTAIDKLVNSIKEKAETAAEAQLVISANSLQGLEKYDPFELLIILKYSLMLYGGWKQDDAISMLDLELGYIINIDKVEILVHKYHAQLNQLEKGDFFDVEGYVIDLFKIALINSKITMKSPNYPMVKAFILSDFNDPDINKENDQFIQDYETLFQEQIKEYERDISNYPELSENPTEAEKERVTRCIFNPVDTPVDYYRAVAFLIENSFKESKSIIMIAIDSAMPYVIKDAKLKISNFMRDLQTKKINMNSPDYEHNRNIVMVHGSEASKKFIKEYEGKQMTNTPDSKLTTTDQIMKGPELG